uniref:Fungal N-terminal domain-containing protein n=1 Tax=Colletotrichum fructicola (strain Nara gc5) TaxID=1213859 RepID=L2G5F7_COLFN
MDPITIITAAASLAGAVLTASLKIKNTLDHLDNAPQNVCDIAEEIYAVQYALSQVEDVVRRDPNVIDRLALEDVFALAVKGCHATLLLIHKEYEQLFAKSDWKTKILVLWKDGEMTRLLGRLDRKKATLTLLTQTLNLRSTQDIKDLLIQNQSTLVAARQDSFETVPIKTALGAKAADPAEEDQLDSVYGDNESILSTTETPKAAPMNVDKPLPELVEEASPASLQPVAEEKLDDVTESINLSGETLASQYTLSRATTLLPEYEAVESSTLSPVSSTTSVEKHVQSETNFSNSQPQVPAPQWGDCIKLTETRSLTEGDLMEDLLS